MLKKLNWVIVCGLVFGGAAYAAEHGASHPVSHSAHQNQAQAPKEDVGVPSDQSVYLLESEWKDQAGKKTLISTLKGKVVVAAMAYTSCGYACPLIIADLKRIEAGLSPEALKNTRFVLFSLDPERDTPMKLKEYAEKKKLDLSRWTLLTSGADSVQDLAAVLGVKYKKTKSGDFSHSNIISVLNRQGEIKHQQIGLNQSPKESIEAIVKLSQ